MIITCPRCFQADEVSYVKAPGGGYIYTCGGAHSGDGPHIWLADPHDPTIDTTGSSKEGVTSDLLIPMEQIVRSFPHVWLEHGVIEYELRLQYPDIFASHVRDRGHVLLGRAQNTASGTGFALALVQLRTARVLVHRHGPATGAWSYDTSVSYWATPPAPDEQDQVTWAQRCADLGRDPDWTDADRRQVQAMIRTLGA